MKKKRKVTVCVNNVKNVHILFLAFVAKKKQTVSSAFTRLKKLFPESKKKNHNKHNLICERLSSKAWLLRYLKCFSSYCLPSSECPLLASQKDNDVCPPAGIRSMWISTMLSCLSIWQPPQEKITRKQNHLHYVSRVHDCFWGKRH